MTSGLICRKWSNVDNSWWNKHIFKLLIHDFSLPNYNLGFNCTKLRTTDPMPWTTCLVGLKHRRVFLILEVWWWLLNTLISDLMIVATAVNLFNFLIFFWWIDKSDLVLESIPFFCYLYLMHKIMTNWHTHTGLCRFGYFERSDIGDSLHCNRW